MKILTNCNEFLTKNRKNILYVMGFIFVFFILSDFSFAENSNVSDTNPDNKNFGISLLNGVLKNLAALLGLLTFLVGLFLAPEWTSGSIVGLGGSGGALKQMWIMMSNVVYFIFAMIFIWIAFMNIIGKDADTYGLKSAMPRFIVGVLIVPFTWFLVQFILSISSILTVGVLSLPYDTFKDTYMKDEDLKKVTFCKDWVIYTGTQPKDKKIMDCKDKGSTINLKDIVNPEKSESLFGIMSIYTYGVMSVDGNGKVYSENLVVNGLGNLFDLGIKVLFDLVFVVVYFILMIALALALFVRGVYLWFYAMLSPVFGLLYFFKKHNDGMGDAGKKFNLKEFIALAFVPVYVSAALAFGLLFIFAAGNSWGKQSTGIISEDGKEVKHAGMSYTIEGPSTNDGDAKSSIKKVFTGFQGTFGTLILQVFGLAILWIAVMAALKQSSITQNVIDPFDKFGDSIGQLAMKAPTYAPIIPTGSGMMSAQALQRVGSMPQNAMEKRVADQISPFQNKFDKMFGVSTIPVNDIANIKTKMNVIDNNEELKEIQKDLRAVAGTYGTNSSQYQNLLTEFNEKVKANSSLKSLSTDKPLFDNTGKLTVDGVKLLHNNIQDTALGDRAINEKYAEKVWQGGNKSNQTTSDTPLPPSIIRDVNTPGKYQVGNTNITINNNDGGKNLSATDVNTLATALQQTKTTDGENKVKQVLNLMGITDVSKQTEVLNKISSTTTTPPPTQTP